MLGTDLFYSNSILLGSQIMDQSRKEFLNFAPPPPHATRRVDRSGFAQAGAVRCEDCPPGEVPVLPSHLVS